MSRPGGDGLVSLKAFVDAHDDHTLWMGPAGTFNVLPYEHDTLPFDLRLNSNQVIVAVAAALVAVALWFLMRRTRIAEAAELRQFGLAAESGEIVRSRAASFPAAPISPPRTAAAARRRRPGRRACRKTR